MDNAANSFRLKSLFVVRRVDRNFERRDAILPKARDELREFKSVLETLREHKRNFFVPDPDLVWAFLSSFSRYGVMALDETGGPMKKVLKLKPKEPSLKRASEALEATHRYLGMVKHNQANFEVVVSKLRDLSPAFASAFIALYVSEDQSKRILQEANRKLHSSLAELAKLFETLAMMDTVLAHAMISLPLKFEFTGTLSNPHLKVDLPTGWRSSPYLYVNLAYSSNLEAVKKEIDNFFSSLDEEYQETHPVEVHSGITVVERCIYEPRKDGAVAAR